MPLYTRVTGLSFNLRIKVTPLEDIQGVEIRQVAGALLSVVDDTLARIIILQNRYITLSYLARDKGKVVRCFLLDIKIHSIKREFLFSQAVQELFKFYYEIKTIGNLNLATGITVGLKYDIGHGIEQSWTGLIDLMHPGDGNFRVLIKDEQGVQGPKNYMTLTDLNWCARTELSPSDVEKLDPFVF